MNTETGTLLLEMYRPRFEAAHYNTSFYPEKRADSMVKDFSEELTEDLKELEASTGNYREKYIQKLMAYVDRRSRCMSFMIVGPANFPVARNAKNNRYADNAWEEFRNWRTRYIKRAFSVPTPSPEDDLDKALKDLDKSIEAHETMKIVNKHLRKFKVPFDERFVNIQKELECSDQLITQLKEPDCYGAYGFASYSLTNSNARIKALKEKVLTMKARISRKATWEPIQFMGGSIDIQSDRVVIFHDEKPESEVIQSLKSRGFRWSRNYGCWCRKHTANALYVAKQICGVLI